MCPQLGIRPHVLDRSALVDHRLDQLVDHVRRAASGSSAQRAGIPARREPSGRVAHDPWCHRAVLDQQRPDSSQRAGPEAWLKSGDGQAAGGDSLQHLGDRPLLLVELVALEDRLHVWTDRRGRGGAWIDRERSRHPLAQRPRQEVEEAGELVFVPADGEDVVSVGAEQPL